MTPAAVISSVSYILHCCQPGASAHFYFPFLASLAPQPTCSWKLTPRCKMHVSWGTRILHSFFQILDMTPSSIICTRLVTCGLAQASKASLDLASGSPADLRGMDYRILPKKRSTVLTPARVTEIVRRSCTSWNRDTGQRRFLATLNAHQDT